MQRVSEKCRLGVITTLQEIIELWSLLSPADLQELNPTAATTAATKYLILD
jgi:hypothetical protein